MALSVTLSSQWPEVHTPLNKNIPCLDVWQRNGVKDVQERRQIYNKRHKIIPVIHEIIIPFPQIKKM